MYKEIYITGTKEVNPSLIKRDDGAFIPFDPANTCYQAYLKWLDAGNTPEAADAAPAQEG